MLQDAVRPLPRYGGLSRLCKFRSISLPSPNKRELFRVLITPLALHTQVEAPSQMNENFIWTPSIIKRVSSHYERQGETLPDDLIDKLIKSRKLGQGLFNLRQLFFGKVSDPPSLRLNLLASPGIAPARTMEDKSVTGTFETNADSRAGTHTPLQYDMALHTDKYNLSPDEMSKLWCDLREQTSLVTIGDQVVGGQSGFAHIAGQSPLSASLCEQLLAVVSICSVAIAVSPWRFRCKRLTRHLLCRRRLLGWCVSPYKRRPAGEAADGNATCSLQATTDICTRKCSRPTCTRPCSRRTRWMPPPDSATVARF